MAKKRVNPTERLHGECPTNIDNSSFYGLELDEEQKKFVNAILNPDNLIVFCNAKAGCGKSICALGAANLLTQYGVYDKIYYITFPLYDGTGYLKGSLEDKEAPSFAPLYDGMIELGMNPNTVMMTEENQKYGGYIKAMSHFYLRGCNMSNTVVIIDEAQNGYTDELKKVLTRIKDDCKTIVIGHSGQCDLYKHPENSGFTKYIEHYKDRPWAEVCELTTNHRGLVSSWADELIE